MFTYYIRKAQGSYNQYIPQGYSAVESIFYAFLFKVDMYLAAHDQRVFDKLPATDFLRSFSPESLENIDRYTMPIVQAIITRWVNTNIISIFL
jgi:hypothetical protein